MYLLRINRPCQAAPVLSRSQYADYTHHCLYLLCLNPSRRRTRLRSTLATGRSLSKERRTRFDFLLRKWLSRCFRRRSLPLPVILKRFAVALCVFILGTMVTLSHF
jgi:hypothetical protein